MAIECPALKGTAVSPYPRVLGHWRRGRKNFGAGDREWHGELTSRHDLANTHLDSQLLCTFLHNRGLLTPFPYLWKGEALGSEQCWGKGGSQGLTLCGRGRFSGPDLVWKVEALRFWPCLIWPREALAVLAFPEHLYPVHSCWEEETFSSVV